MPATLTVTVRDYLGDAYLISMPAIPIGPEAFWDEVLTVLKTRMDTTFPIRIIDTKVVEP